MIQAGNALSWMVAVCCLVPPTATATEAAADSLAAALSGTWILNQEESDDPQEAMARPGAESGRQEEGKGGGGMRGGGRGGGGRGGGGARGGMGGMGGGSGKMGPGNPPPDSDRAQEAMRRRKEISYLEIFLDGIELNITNGLDISRLLFCDGREVSIWTERGEVKATAQRQGNTIIETWESGRGGERIRTLGISEDGNQLILTENRPRPGSDETISIRLIYDRQP